MYPVDVWLHQAAWNILNSVHLQSVLGQAKYWLNNEHKCSEASSLLTSVTIQFIFCKTWRKTHCTFIWSIITDLTQPWHERDMQPKKLLSFQNSKNGNSVVFAEYKSQIQILSMIMEGTVDMLTQWPAHLDDSYNHNSKEPTTQISRSLWPFPCSLHLSTLEWGLTPMLFLESGQLYTSGKRMENWDTGTESMYARFNVTLTP